MDRVYSAEEAATILADAARLQGVDGPSTATGLTLAELEQVAAEAGIDGTHVAAAAAGMEPPTRSGRPLGFRAEATRSRTLNGPVDEEQWGQIVADLRRRFGGVGVTSEVGSVRAWASAASDREVPVYASLEPAGSGSKLTISQRPGEIIAILTAVGMGVSAMIGLATLLSDESTGVGIGALIIAVGIYVVTRMWYDGSIRRTEAEFESALTRAALLVESGKAGMSPVSTQTAPAPAVSLDDLPDAGDEQSDEEGRRLRT